MTTVHQIRVQDLSSSPTLTALCAGYELGKWRAEHLVQDVFDRHLASFALSFTDWHSIDGETAAKSLRKAAQAVYSTDKYGRRGEFGELLLHAAATDFFGARPAVCKIHYKDSANDTVKGFDCVHLVKHGAEMELWLGEVKYYADLNAAIRDSTDELKAHLASGFLRAEFVAITNKLEAQLPEAEELHELLDQATSMDEILPRIVVPVMLTYNSPAVMGHDSLTTAYSAELHAETQEAWTKFADKLEVPYPVSLHLILVPLRDKKDLTDLFHAKLKIWQQI